MLSLLEDIRIDDVINIFLVLYYIKQIDSMLPCVCSVIDHSRETSKCCKNIPHFDVLCDNTGQTQGNMEFIC